MTATSANTTEEGVTIPRCRVLIDNFKVLKPHAGQRSPGRSLPRRKLQSARTSFDTLCATVDVACHPTTIEVSGLRNDLLAVDKAAPAAVFRLSAGRSVEAEVVGDGLEAGRWRLIRPDARPDRSGLRRERWQSECVIRCRALPLRTAEVKGTEDQNQADCLSETRRTSQNECFVSVSSLTLVESALGGK